MNAEVRQTVLLTAAIMCFLSAAALLLFALWQFWRHGRDRRRCTGQATGHVVGEVELTASATHTAGDVPPAALSAWFRDAGFLFHASGSIGGTTNGAFIYLWISLLRGLSPWRFFPCVAFTAPQGERTAVTLTGVRRDRLPIGQDVTVRYDPELPRRFYLEEAGRPRPPVSFWAGAVFVVAGLCLLVFSRF